MTETVIICGTGPSITQEQISLCNNARKAGKAKVFGANRAYEIFDIDLLHACNFQFWDLHWPKVKDLPFEKWTTRPGLNYDGLNYIEEIWIDGLSTDPKTISAHHGTGPQLLNLAYHFGFKRLLLVGWDMRFPGKVSDRKYTQKRRYLGEDPLTSNHWPKTEANGDLGGLIREVETIIPEDYGIEIINCTPNSALKCFPMMELSDCLT